MDARDLVLNEDIRNYWKDNDIFSSWKDQLRLILRAYCPVEKKLEYLKQLNDFSETSEFQSAYKNYLVTAYMKVCNKDRDSIYDDSYLKIYQVGYINIYEPREEYISNLFDSNYIELRKRLFFNLNECLDYVDNSTSDFYIFETVVDKDTNKVIDSYIRIYIIDKQLSCIFRNHCLNQEAEDEFDFLLDCYCGSYFSDPDKNVFPFKNGTKVSIKTNDMKYPFVGYYNSSKDCYGTEYITIYNEPEIIRKNNIEGPELSALTFRYSYNLYDWIKKEI